MFSLRLPRRLPAATLAMRVCAAIVRGVPAGTLLLLLATPAPTRAQGSDTRLAAPARTDSAPGAAGVSAAGPGVLPGDALKLVIWREPDLSGEFAVDETGTVTLPKVGAMRVVGESTPALKARVIAAYQRFLTHSAIEVTVLRRVQVTGAVRTPGVYRVDPTMTLGDALALAGGATTEGVQDRVELLRRGERVSSRLRYRTQIGEAEIRSGDQIYVPERGWSSRRIGLVSAALGTSVALLIAVMNH
jgi:protein involved in polysaccharide export with SLBB domain